MFKKLVLLVSLSLLMVAGNAMADTSVSWLTPANGSTYNVGTILGDTQPEGPITGVASASGSTGGTGLDLVLVIDVSGSMGWDVDPYTAGTQSGLDFAKSAAHAMINSLPDHTTQLGIVKFDSSAGTVSDLIDLTANKTALHNAVDTLNASGGTNIGSGIDRATTLLTGSNAIASHSKMQVVLSDGDSTGYPNVSAANAYNNHSITVHSVGVPGHNQTQMASIATAGHGVYTDVTDITTLESLFDGTGGNLVGIDHVDVELADGTMINDIALDGLGNFSLPDWAVVNGPQTFTATAYATDGSIASADLTINGVTNGVTTPEPATVLLLGTGLAGIAGLRRKQKK